MTLLRRLILALALSAGLSPVFAQPAPVPALPDTERRTSYSISGTTCACNVNFALYGDGSDYQNWVEVYLNGVRVNYNDATYGWTITSPSGTIGNLALPITDALLTFTNAQTGTVQIVGARRPRRTSQFNEGIGVPTRNFNVVFSDITAQLREVWDKTNDFTGRGMFGIPGETISLMPPAATRAGGFMCWDATGLIPSVCAPISGTGNVNGPNTSTGGHLATWNNATGTLLADLGPGGTLPASLIFPTPSITGLMQQNNSSPGGSEIAFESHDATMAATNQLLWVLGRDESTSDRASFGFRYSGLNSVNNHGWLGLYGQDHIINWDGNGYVGIGTGNNNLDKCFSVSSDSNFSIDCSGNQTNAGNINSGGIPTFTGRGGNFGPGGSTGGNQAFNLNGANTVNGGSYFSFNLAGVPQWYLGENRSIFGGGIEDFLLYNAINALGEVLGVNVTTGGVRAPYGLTSIGPTQGIGYAAGAGCSQTQPTNRTTGVTCNTVAMKITLFSAPGTSTPATFTVTDSAIGADDTISCTQFSGANTYRCYAGPITAGTSFKLTQEASVGTATEAPVFNVTIQRGAHN